jgi:hypothetical protein
MGRRAGMHQGYELYWLTPGEPSGTVYMYVEEETQPRGTWPTLLDYLVHYAGQQKQTRDRYNL